MLAQLPALAVIIPLLSAPLCLLLRRSLLAWLFTVTASGLTMVVSIALLQQVMASGTIVYEMGGWSPPWGIEYRVDKLNAYLLLIVTSISTVVLLAAHTSIEKEIPQHRHTLFYVLYLLSLTGLLGVVTTGDAFNAFVFLEVSSLAAYSLIALGEDRRALWAAYQYLIMGTIGATFILIGIGLMYQMTGTLNMDDLSRRLPEVAQTRTVFAAFAFIIVGVCLKVALFPLHRWLPNAYAYAPLGGNGSPGCHFYQSRRVFAHPLYLLGFRDFVFLYDGAFTNHLRNTWAIGNIRRFDYGHLSKKCKTFICLLQRRPDWLHDRRLQYRHDNGSHGNPVAPV